MCGICGTYEFSGTRPVAPDVLEQMNATLFHRGPDGGGIHVDGPVGLAARRLAIIDLEHGDQPMQTADGEICAVQNGEILNHLELRSSLERSGAQFRTRCDTEVLLHLYLRDGPAFVSQLRGMFALALWDRREQRLLLARDRFGIKPLHYELGSGRLSFASELKALVRQPWFSRRPEARRTSGATSSSGTALPWSKANRASIACLRLPASTSRTATRQASRSKGRM